MKSVQHTEQAFVLPLAIQLDICMPNLDTAANGDMIGRTIFQKKILRDTSSPHLRDPSDLKQDVTQEKKQYSGFTMPFHALLWSVLLLH